MLKFYKISFFLGCLLLFPLTARSVELEDVIRIAVANSPRMKSQIYSYQGNTKFLKAKGLSGFMPNISYGFQSQYSDNVENSSSNNFYAYGLSEVSQLSMNQTLIDGGENAANFKKSKYLLEVEKANFDATKQRVMLDAVNAYVRVITADEVYKLSKHNEKVLGEHLLVAKKRLALKEITKTDVSQAQSRLSSAEAEASKALGDLKTANSFFVHVVGDEPRGLVHPSRLPAPPSSLIASLKLAKKNNPYLYSAVYNQKAAKEDTHIALSRLLPSVGLSASVNWNNYELTPNFRPQLLPVKHALSLNLSVPIFQKGLGIASVQQSKMMEKRSMYDYYEAVRSIEESVLSNWENVSTAAAIVKASKDAVKASSIALEGVKQEANFYLRTTLDVLDSEQELFQVKVNLINAQGNYVISIYTLLSLIGELNVS